ncbi:DUF551 domain-containing protein [Enterobacter hormaechei]|uniref:DUF551 domain-containing protein n=1 Tax=Enterobacter hormaechei TaxID=158836 RepID=UPI00058238E0|nr:DUF551 domain-containing protein [Enterobacter hormaechei]AJB62265.1 hypothetical protein LI62_09365 [Enterobacter hormaechei subsp. steigerwaltii]KJO31054.1 hypothetical protein SS08_09445 [Enterobacter hormaechei subsp. steigerwaltii]
MSTLTKEWLLKTIAELEEERDATPGAVNEDADMALAAMKLALASLEAEPVAYIFKHPAGRLFWSLTDESNKGQSDVMPVYTAPPSPVAVLDDNAITQHFDTIALETAREIMCDVNRRHEFLGGEVQLLSRIQCRIDDACRSAMLQGAEPVTTVYKLRDAVEVIRNSGIAIDGEMILAERDALNSPVTPDGWVACSERMPEIGIKVLCFPVNDEPIHATYNGQVWLQDISWSTSDEPIDNAIPCNVFHWMPLPAAPQQEVK